MAKFFYDVPISGPFVVSMDFGGQVSSYHVYFTKKHSDVIQGNGRSYPIEVTGNYSIESVRSDHLAGIIAEVLKHGYRISEIVLA